MPGGGGPVNGNFPLKHIFFFFYAFPYTYPSAFYVTPCFLPFQHRPHCRLIPLTTYHILNPCYIPVFPPQLPGNPPLHTVAVVSHSVSLSSVLLLHRYCHRQSRLPTPPNFHLLKLHILKLINTIIYQRSHINFLTMPPFRC